MDDKLKDFVKELQKKVESGNYSNEDRKQLIELLKLQKKDNTDNNYKFPEKELSNIEKGRYSKKDRDIILQHAGKRLSEYENRRTFNEKYRLSAIKTLGLYLVYAILIFSLLGHLNLKNIITIFY